MKAKTAGEPASSGRGPMTTDAPKTISPAAHKFAKYLARRMAPMIESATKQPGANNQSTMPARGNRMTP
jgi:hypothetical protein